MRYADEEISETDVAFDTVSIHAPPEGRDLSVSSRIHSLLGYGFNPRAPGGARWQLRQHPGKQQYHRRYNAVSIHAPPEGRDQDTSRHIRDLTQ